MHLYATLDEKLELIHKALTTGLPYFVDYGFRLRYSQDDYKTAKAVLTDSTGKEAPYVEQVQIQMLRLGFPLTFEDVEGEGENTKVLTVALMESNWEKIPFKVIGAMFDDAYDWDARDADVFMQYILFGSVVYG